MKPQDEQADELVGVLKERSLTMACAESCTGGLVAALVTAIPGASEVFWGGVVAYSNECKVRLLGVARETIDDFGAVSPETAREMARRALASSGADIGLAITGIAGPGGGTPEKPVGLVYLAWATSRGEAFDEALMLEGDRDAIRRAAARRAIVQTAAMAAGMGPGRPDRGE